MQLPTSAGSDGLTTASSPKVQDFIRNVRSPSNEWFAPGLPVLVVRAPGRLDVMGGIADTTGSLVLEMPLARAVVLAVQARDDQRVVICSLSQERPGQDAEFAWPLAWLYEEGGETATSPRAFAARFEGHDAAWARGLAGVFYMLLADKAVDHFGGGATIVFDATATRPAGIGSTGALQAATVFALAALYDLSLDPMEAARICRRAENRIVGVPCGVMDPAVSLTGQADALLQLRCQPHDALGHLSLPEGVTAIGVHSGVRHRGGARRYVEVRAAAAMGHRMILDRMQREGVRGDPTRGYLANVTPEEFVERFRDRLPTKIRGAEFLSRYGETTDAATRVDPETVYKVRSRTEHHIYENRRVHQFAERISRALRTGHRGPVAEAGELMYASHWSYGQRCGLGCIETDLLSTMVRQRGVEQGFYGAKTSGAGAGGTVVVLMDDTDANHAAVEQIVAAYADRTGRSPEILRGSSDGAIAFGVHRVEAPSSKSESLAQGDLQRR